MLREPADVADVIRVNERDLRPPRNWLWAAWLNPEAALQCLVWSHRSPSEKSTSYARSWGRDFRPTSRNHAGRIVWNCGSFAELEGAACPNGFGPCRRIVKVRIGSGPAYRGLSMAGPLGVLQLSKGTRMSRLSHISVVLRPGSKAELANS
jgi:hypothetical protein